MEYCMSEAENTKNMFLFMGAIAGLIMGVYWGLVIAVNANPVVGYDYNWTGKRCVYGRILFPVSGRIQEGRRSDNKRGRFASKTSG